MSYAAVCHLFKHLSKHQTIYICRDYFIHHWNSATWKQWLYCGTQWHYSVVWGRESWTEKPRGTFYGRENYIKLYVSSQWSRSNAPLVEADEELVVAFSSQSFGATRYRRSYLSVYNRTRFVLLSYLKMLVRTACILPGCGWVHDSQRSCAP